MLKFIVGKDTERAVARGRELEGFVLRETLKGDELSISSLKSKAGEETLFGDTRAYIADGEIDERFAKELTTISGALLSSSHLFVFEAEGDASLIKLLEKTKGKVVKVKAPPKATSFDVFSLAGAYASKDKKKLWLLLQEAYEAGVPTEAIVGILSWKARSILALKGPRDKKAVADSSLLVRMYHDAHRGEGDLSLLLERFVLSL